MKAKREMWALQTEGLKQTNLLGCSEQLVMTVSFLLSNLGLTKGVVQRPLLHHPLLPRPEQISSRQKSLAGLLLAGPEKSNDSVNVYLCGILLCCTKVKDHGAGHLNTSNKCPSCLINNA